jgi:hypothetical protein
MFARVLELLLSLDTFSVPLPQIEQNIRRPQTNVVKWTIGGAIGGLVGAGIWAAVGHYSNSEVGWIAWGIGFLVGFGVRAAAQEDEGFGPGGVATAIAIGSVVLGKYLVITWAFSGISGELANMEVTGEDMISTVAMEIAEERKSAGQTVIWPEDIAEEAPASESFPPDIWAEASKKWNATPENEKQEQIEERNQEIAEFAAMLGDAFKGTAFRDSFAAWDLLWLGLASITAFKLGSGLASDD